MIFKVLSFLRLTHGLFLYEEVISVRLYVEILTQNIQGDGYWIKIRFL